MFPKTLIILRTNLYVSDKNISESFLEFINFKIVGVGVFDLQLV